MNLQPVLIDDILKDRGNEFKVVVRIEKKNPIPKR